MTFLPIRFRTKINKTKSQEIGTSEILDIIEKYLDDRRYNYIIRKKNRILFHHANLLLLQWKYKSWLIGGTVRVIEKKDSIIIENGFWFMFFLLIPFVLLLLLSNSKFSTLDNSDTEIIWFFLFVVFLSLLIQIRAHWVFRNRIKAEIERTIPNNELW